MAAATLLLCGSFCVSPASGLEGDRFHNAFRIADGDSAIHALVEAAELDPDHPLAPEALLRAGFIAYVLGESERAQELFEMSHDAGSSEAGIWRCLALLSAGRVDAAARCLRGFDAGDAGDAGVGAEAAALALAACELIDGDVGDGEAKCREIVDEGGRYAVAASLLLRRSVPGALDPEENDRWAGLITQPHPLSYESVLARHLPAVEREEPDGTEEEIIEEDMGGAGAPGAGEILEGDSASEEKGESTSDQDVSGGESPGSSRVFCVQVGAFADVRNAETLVQDLLTKGYGAVRVESETRKGTLFHCVRVGRFASRDDALVQARALERDEDLGTQVMESKK